MPRIFALFVSVIFTAYLSLFFNSGALSTCSALFGVVLLEKNNAIPLSDWLFDR